MHRTTSPETASRARPPRAALSRAEADAASATMPPCRSPSTGGRWCSTGPNGAGKTNLLEAVSFLSPGRGPAPAPGSTRWRASPATAPGRWRRRSRTPPARSNSAPASRMTPEGPEGRRSVRVNRAPARSPDALLDHLRVVWLTPAMDGLFTGPAADRRRFLDRAVLAIDRGHGTRVNAFEQAMRGRNRLLGEPSPDPRWLDAIEREMAELGIAIAAARREWAGLAVALIAEGDVAAPLPGRGNRARRHARAPARRSAGERRRGDLCRRPRRRAAARRRRRTDALRPASLRPPRPPRAPSRRPPRSARPASRRRC